MSLESLDYNDRVQNAINFSFFKARDTDKLLLDSLDPDLRLSVDPKGQKTLLEIYEILFQENPPPCIISTRKRGNATITPLDRYESFFPCYTTTTLTPNKSREKLLQMCIVLKFGVKKTEEILKEIGCQGLYAASLFENCIWYILETNGTLYDLYTLYDEALHTVGNSTINPNSIYEQDAPSHSCLETTFFLGARCEHLTPSHLLDKNDFLAFVEEMGPYFRYHKYSISTLYDTFTNEDVTDRVQISSLYSFFRSCLNNTQSAFLEQHRQFSSGNSHIKYPSRETMILVGLYHKMLTLAEKEPDLSFAYPLDLNHMLRSCGYPQLNKQFPFDHVIMEMLAYLPNKIDNQLSMVGRLLPLYQFAFDCKALNLTGSALYEVVNAFDILLCINHRNTASFLTSLQLLGRAAQQYTSDVGTKEYFVPCRELMMLLRIAEQLISNAKLSSISLNRFLNNIGFSPLSNRGFDRWISIWISLSKKDMFLRLRPFFLFILSFKQFKGKSSTKVDQESFSKFYKHISALNTLNTENGELKGELTSVLNALFSSLEDLSGTSKTRTKLLDHQVAVQTIFSYLEIQAFSSADSLENMILSIEGQTKYEPRKLKGSNDKPYVNKFYNLHYGNYTLKFSYTWNGQSRTFSHQINLSPASPSLTLRVDYAQSKVTENTDA